MVHTKLFTNMFIANICAFTTEYIFPSNMNLELKI